MRLEQQARRKELLERLDSEDCVSSDNSSTLNGMIQYVNNEALGVDVRELVFERTEQKSNRLTHERAKFRKTDKYLNILFQIEFLKFAGNY